MRHAVTLPIASEILVAAPCAPYDRRLSDKILAAFAHAYEVGEVAVAATLRRVLEDAEQRTGGLSFDRRQSNVLRQADLLVEFVDARNAYKQATGRTPQDPEEIDRTSREMLEAYRRWSSS